MRVALCGKRRVTPELLRACRPALRVLCCSAAMVDFVLVCRSYGAHTSQEAKDGWNSKIVLVALVKEERNDRGL